MGKSKELPLERGFKFLPIFCTEYVRLNIFFCSFFVFPLGLDLSKNILLTASIEGNIGFSSEITYFFLQLLVEELPQWSADAQIESHFYL